jgi:hypothetical protein
LSSADHEWAEWGQENSSVEQSTSKSNEPDADAPSSESDSDDDPTFLSLQHRPKVQSLSATQLAARPVASSNKPASKSLIRDEDEDNVDWEDGEDVEMDGEQVEKKMLLNKSSAPHAQYLVTNNVVQQDGGIDCEDGGEDNQGDHLEDVKDVIEWVSKKDACHINHNHYTTRQILQSSLEADGSNDVVILSDVDGIEISSGNTKPHFYSVNMEKEMIHANEIIHMTTLKSDPNLNAFEMEGLNTNDPTTAALRHAQETASKLTDWAGRAVQRAIAAHIEEKGGSPPKKMIDKKHHLLDLNAGEEDGNGSDLEQRYINDSAATNNTKGLHTGSYKLVDLFDTSLESLNKVHHDILEEEKLMERDMSTITDEMKEDILNLLQLCGIPWLESPSEAEAQCAALEELGLVDGIVTEDSDIFVFGGRKVYKVSFNY